MTDRQRLGKQGEDYALKHLQKAGFKLLERNWRYHKAEVDLIMMDRDCLVFVEVKTRSTDAFGHPLAFVRSRQLTLLSDAAVAYMEQINHHWELRFDLLAVVISAADQSYTIEHIKDAFFPGIHDL